VVDASLGIPTGCAGKLRRQTAGMLGGATMAEPWDSVGKAAMAGTYKVQERLLDGCDAHTGGATLVGTLQAR
jgi:hypothetical protein